MPGADQLREIAEECRTLALATRAPEIRTQLLQVAAQFLRLAEHHEATHDRRQLRPSAHLATE